jgi:hypothetical protein
MTRGSLAVSAIACVVTLAIIGCKGDTGPAGPPGLNGNANVETGTFTLKDTAFTNTFWAVSLGGGTSLGDAARVASVPVPAITAGIADSGVVLAFINNPVGFTDSTQWVPLPYIFGPISPGYLVKYDFGASTGLLRIAYVYIASDAGTTPPSVYAAVVPTQEYKYVAMAGTVAAALSDAHVKLTDYSQVMAALRARGYLLRP